MTEGMTDTTVYLTPGEAKQGPINFNTSDGMKFYNNAVKGLEVKYDLKPAGLKAFIESIRRRCDTYGMNDVLMVPYLSPSVLNVARNTMTDSSANAATATTTPIAAAARAAEDSETEASAATTTGGIGERETITRNILSMYGTVTMLECQVAAFRYYTNPGRKAQNAVMLFDFISNSVNDEAISILTVESFRYSINGRNDGVCFLKHLVSKVQIDTISTVNTLRREVRKLDEKIAEYNGNLIKFNEYVKRIMIALASYNETCPEMLASLFDAYCTIDDSAFNNYIMNKRSSWEDGTYYPSIASIMNLVENHYKLRIQNSTWKGHTIKNSEITALKSQVIEHTGKLNAHKFSKVDRDIKFSWKKIPPANNNIQQVKTFEGRNYHWCTKHQLWTIHTDAECKGVGAFKSNRQSTDKPTTINTPSKMNVVPTVVVDTEVNQANEVDIEPYVL
jgi:hypothetical protein